MVSRRALKRKAKDFDDAATNHTAFHNPSVRRLEFTVTADAGSARTTSTLGRMSAVPAKKPTLQEQPITEDEVPEPEKQKLTRYCSITINKICLRYAPAWEWMF
ncbi:hypothetical protein B0H14DRAFT_2622947 [Mycena olivaceomarginata]|nr:hypothetical protein B0H14DRAFT_2622947 [Mycena olivaceomarginata]